MDHLLDKDLALKDTAQVDGEKFFISTIKMEVRHSWLNQHENVFVYETMVFEQDGEQVKYQHPVFNRRYSSCEEAERGHKHIVENIEKVVKTTRECRAKISG
jgi:hypothetical protein